MLEPRILLLCLCVAMNLDAHVLEAMVQLRTLSSSKRPQKRRPRTSLKLFIKRAVDCLIFTIIPSTSERTLGQPVASTDSRPNRTASYQFRNHGTRREQEQGPRSLRWVQQRPGRKIRRRYGIVRNDCVQCQPISYTD